MSWKDTGIGAHIAAVDLLEGRRVVLDADGNLVYAGASEPGIGVAKYDTDAEEACGVAYWNKPGTMIMVAAGAFAVGDPVFAAASGKVQALPATPGDYVRIGTALESATADGDLVEIMPAEVGGLAPGSLLAGQEVTLGLRLDVNGSGKLVAATASALGVGSALAAVAADAPVPLRTFGGQLPLPMIAAGAVPLGDEVYAAASGKIQSLPTAAGDYVRIGTALEAAADDGDVILVQPSGSGVTVTVTE
ncbi:MAG: capsid cement protein [Desulfovibrionaceae bacterium]